MEMQFHIAVQKLADKLNKDYYPLLDVLSNNACRQIEWLYEQDDKNAGEYLAISEDLDKKIKHHITICKSILQPFMYTAPGEYYIQRTKFGHTIKQYVNIENLENSRDDIKSILRPIKKGFTLPSNEWEDIYGDFFMKLRVINNVLSELFKIENADLLPLLEEQNKKFIDAPVKD